jgi:hypothetical protein
VAGCRCRSWLVLRPSPLKAKGPEPCDWSPSPGCCWLCSAWITPLRHGRLSTVEKMVGTPLPSGNGTPRIAGDCNQIATFASVHRLGCGRRRSALRVADAGHLFLHRPSEGLTALPCGTDKRPRSSAPCVDDSQPRLRLAGCGVLRACRRLPRCHMIPPHSLEPRCPRRDWSSVTSARSLSARSESARRSAPAA